MLTWKARIEQIRTIGADNFIGYHRTYHATEQKRIALLPVGYYDQYERALSNRGVVAFPIKTGNSVTIKYAPIVGLISMNTLTIDVTHIPELRPEDEVILIGDHPKVRACDLAAEIGTNPREVRQEDIKRLVAIPRTLID